MADLHPFGLAGRARGIHHVGQVLGARAAGERVRRLLADHLPITIQGDQGQVVRRQPLDRGLLRQQHSHLRVLHHES